MFVFTAFRVLSIWKATIGRVFEWNSRCNFAKHDQILSEQKVPHLIKNILSIVLSTVFIFHNRPCRSLGERNPTKVGAKYNPLNFPNVSSTYPEIDYLELRIVSISTETISLKKASALWNLCCSSNIVDILCILLSLKLLVNGDNMFIFSQLDLTIIKGNNSVMYLAISSPILKL